MAGRGQLTDKIKIRSKELLGYEIDVKELRLMPYIQYVMTNEQRISSRHINQEEREVLRKWKEVKYIEEGASGLSITKEFWDILCEIIFLGYVDIDL